MIALCEGVFRCDCRGLGTDWEVGELRKISTALLGSVDIVADPAGLTFDFAQLVRGAMSKQLPDVLLRLWTPRGAVVKFVRQVAPAVADLTVRRVPSGALTGDYPTGAWAPGESRDYHVAVTVSAGEVGQQMLAAQVSLMVSSAAGEPDLLGRGLITVTWTDDATLSTRINPRIAGYTGQAELAAAIAEGIQAWRRGDDGAGRRAPRPGGGPRPSGGQRRDRAPAGQRGGRGGCGRRHCPAEEADGRRRRHGARHPVHQHGPGHQGIRRERRRRT